MSFKLCKLLPNAESFVQYLHRLSTISLAVCMSSSLPTNGMFAISCSKVNIWLLNSLIYEIGLPVEALH